MKPWPAVRQESHRASISTVCPLSKAREPRPGSSRDFSPVFRPGECHEVAKAPAASWVPGEASVMIGDQFVDLPSESTAAGRRVPCQLATPVLPCVRFTLTPDGPGGPSPSLAMPAANKKLNQRRPETPE